MIAAGAALCVLLAILCGATALAAPRLAGSGADGRVRRLSVRAAPTPVVPDAGPALRRATASSRLLDRLFDGNQRAATTTLQLQRAGLHLRAGEYFLGRLLLACMAFTLPFLLFSVSAIVIIAAFAVAAAAFWLPAVLVGSLVSRRIRAIDKQLVEVLPSIASSLRAGFALQHSIEAAASQIGPSLSDELFAFLNDISLGANVETALQEMAHRIGSTDLDMVVTAMLVQRTTGGSLADVLEQAAETLRERERIRGDVLTFTAQQRMTGLILSIYPIGIGLLLLAIMPSTWSKMFTEPAGQLLLAIAFGLQVVGFVWIRRALRVEV